MTETKEIRLTRSMSRSRVYCDKKIRLTDAEGRACVSESCIFLNGIKNHVRSERQNLNLRVPFLK